MVKIAHFQQSLPVVEVQLAGRLHRVYDLLDGRQQGCVLSPQLRDLLPNGFGHIDESIGVVLLGVGVRLVESG